jgi:hypothetical protein
MPDNEPDSSSSMHRTPLTPLKVMTMAAPAFTCPECDVALRGADKVPAGKKVKCPSCSAIFVMPEQKKMETSVAIRDKPLPSVPARPVRDDADEDNDEAPRSKRRIPDDDEEETPRRSKRVRDDAETEDEAPRRRKTSAAGEDFDIVEEDDVVVEEEYREGDEEGPRKKRRKKFKKARGPSKGLLIGAIAGIVLLLLGGGGLATYFIFFTNTNNLGTDVEPWTFVQSDANFVMGVDVATLMNDSVFGPQIETLLRGQAGGNSLLDDAKKETGLEFKELAAQVVLAANVDLAAAGNPFGGMGGFGGGMGPGNLPSFTIVMKSSKSFSQAKLANSFKNATRKKLNGKTYYEVSGGGFKYAYMPSNQHLVLTSVNETQLSAILDATKDKPAIAADTVSLLRGISKNTFYLAMPLDAKMRDLMKQAVAGQPGAIQPMGDVMGQAKGFAFYAHLDANTFRLGFNILCADANTASQLAGQADAEFQKQKGALGMLDLFLGNLPKTKQGIKELVGSLKYSTDGANVVATAQVTRQTFNDAVQEIKGQAGNLQGGGLAPGGPGGQQGGMPKGGLGGGQKGGGLPGGKGGGRKRGGG